MLRVLPPLEPVLRQVSLKGFFPWVVKRATSLFRSFCSKVAEQAARFYFSVL